MDVVDAVGERLDERDGIDELVVEVARIEVDAEGGTPPDCRQRLVRGDDIVGDLGRMHLKGEAHADLVEDV